MKMTSPQKPCILITYLNISDVIEVAADQAPNVEFPGSHKHPYKISDSPERTETYKKELIEYFQSQSIKIRNPVENTVANNMADKNEVRKETSFAKKAQTFYQRYFRSAKNNSRICLEIILKSQTSTDKIFIDN